MRVVLIKGPSAYGVLRRFVDELAQAFTARGLDAAVLDVEGLADPFGAMNALAAQGPTRLVFSFGILGEARDRHGRSVGAIFDAPHVLHYVDYPLSHSQRLDRTPREAAILVVDPSHAEAIAAIYGADWFAHLGFCPHAALGEPAVDSSLAEFAQTRPIPILFAGTFYKPGPPGWRVMPPVVASLFDTAVEIASGTEWIPALEALDQALRARGLDLADPSLVPLRKLANFVHEHVRALRRLTFLQAASRVGLPIHVHGQGYEADRARLPNLVFGETHGIDRAIEAMRSARVAINVNANFGEGGHERALTAMAAGAAVASDHSRFYAEAFAPGRDVALFRWTALEKDLAAVGRLAADPAAAFAMAQAAQARVQRAHRWSHRVDTILAAADAARARVRLAA